MATLAEILKKARRAVIRQGIADHDADELVHAAFLKVEQYQRDHEVRSQEALLVRAAVNLSIDRQRRRGHMPLSDGADLHEIADTAPDPVRIIEARARLRQVAAGLELLPERTRRWREGRWRCGQSFDHLSPTHRADPGEEDPLMRISGNRAYAHFANERRTGEGRVVARARS